MERLTRDYDYDNTVTDTYTKRHHHLVQPRDGEACVAVLAVCPYQSVYLSITR